MASYRGYVSVINGFENVNKSISDYTGVKQLAFNGAGYINLTGNTTDYTVTADARYRYAIVDCVPGDVFSLKGPGQLARLWAFVDASDNIISRSPLRSSEEIIIAPYGASKLVANFSSSTDCFFSGISQDIVTLKPGTLVEQSFENDMITEPDKITGMGCIKNGAASPLNYGKDNVIYRIPIRRYSKLHVAFDYQYTDTMPIILCLWFHLILR